VEPRTRPLLEMVWEVEWATSRILLELSRPHPRAGPRGLSLKSAQRVPPLGEQVPVENPEHEVLMVTKENMFYSAAVDGLPCPFFCFVFVCLFAIIKPESPHFASCPGFDVKLLGIYPLGPYVVFLVFCCYVATQLSRQLHQERTQVVCSNKEAWKRLALRHSRNGPWTHECCFEVDVFVLFERTHNQRRGLVADKT